MYKIQGLSMKKSEAVPLHEKIHDFGKFMMSCKFNIHF